METPPLDPPSPDEIRRTHLNHEASLQSVGSLYLLGAVVAVINSVAMILQPGPNGISLFTLASLLAVAALQCWVGLKLRKLDPTAKIPATVLAALGLFLFPIGTIINLYVLYLLHSGKGKTVFTPEYRAVINVTPQIKYNVSIIVWLFVGLLGLLFLIGFIGAFMHSR